MMVPADPRLAAARDLAASRALPLMQMPHANTLGDIAAGSKRLLCAADGLFVESASASLALRFRLASVTTPFGAVDGYVRPAAGAVPRDLIAEFVNHACSNPHVEIAGVIERAGQSHRLRLLGPISSGGAHVTYSDRDVDDETLVVDLHSHGVMRAAFSLTDDESDLSRRGPYIAMVVGRCGPDQTPEIAARLVQPPYLHNLNYSDLVLMGVIK